MIYSDNTLLNCINIIIKLILQIARRGFPTGLTCHSNSCLFCLLHCLLEFLCFRRCHKCILPPCLCLHNLCLLFFHSCHIHNRHSHRFRMLNGLDFCFCRLCMCVLLGFCYLPLYLWLSRILLIYYKKASKRWLFLKAKTGYNSVFYLNIIANLN